MNETKHESVRAGQNKLALLGYSIISAILEAAYAVEVVKGNREMAYFYLFSAVVILPFATCLAIYKKNRESEIFKYVFATGYMVLYTFVMLTGSTSLVFVYILPVFVLFTLYFDMRISVGGSVVAVVVNVIAIISRHLTSPLTETEITNAEIQLAVILLVGIYLILVARFIDRTNYDSLRQIADGQIEAMMARQVAEQERAKAEKASQSKSEFLSNMSHEIRTPLNAIIGMNEMILRETDNPDIFNYAKTAQNSSNALLALINDILDISKIEAGKIEIVPDDYEVTSVFVDGYNMIADRAKAKNLELIFTCDQTLPKTVHGDMVRVRQIFVNILTNAVKYTQEGQVKATMTGEKGEFDQLLLKFIVEDTGIGMTPENVAKLFDKFERFDLKENRTIEGTGLGMSITKELVSLMGGQIDVDSVYGEGSTFTITIPQTIVDKTPIGEFAIDMKADMGEEAYYTERFTAPKARVLVVDDVESNLKVFSNLLKPTKIQVTTALSGKECIDLCCHETFDMIFMDHMMPEMDGIETFINLRIKPENKNVFTPIIMLTANAVTGEREKYLSVGFSNYLTKPIRVEKLEEMIVRYLPYEKVIKAGDAVPVANETKDGAGVSTGADAADATAATVDAAAATATEAMSDVADVTATEEAAVPATNGDSDDETATGFAAIRGLSAADALTYCGGDEEFVWEMLEDYAGNGRFDKLGAFYEAKDWENYRIEVHALKSTSRTVGLMDLGNLAEALEHAAREEDVAFVTEHHEPMMAVYQATLEDIAKAMP